MPPLSAGAPRRVAGRRDQTPLPREELALLTLPAACSRSSFAIYQSSSPPPMQVADVRCGNEFVRGISGGERKRVNIGMELVMAPSGTHHQLS